MRTADVLPILGVSNQVIARLRDRAAIGEPVGSGTRHTWSPGDVLAMGIVHDLAGPSDGRVSRFAEGARKCGEALDNGYAPAYLVTRGGPEYVVVIESDSPGATDEMVASLLLSAVDAGCAVRVVKLRTMVAALEPHLRELIDA